MYELIFRKQVNTGCRSFLCLLCKKKALSDHKSFCLQLFLPVLPVILRKPPDLLPCIQCDLTGKYRLFFHYLFCSGKHICDTILFSDIQINFPIQSAKGHIINSSSKGRQILALPAVHLDQKDIFHFLTDPCRQLCPKCCVATEMLRQQNAIQINPGTVACRFDIQKDPFSFPVLFRYKAFSVRTVLLVDAFVKIMKRCDSSCMWQFYLCPFRKPSCFLFTQSWSIFFKKSPSSVPVDPVFPVSVHCLSSFMPWISTCIISCSASS